MQIFFHVHGGQFSQYKQIAEYWVFLSSRKTKSFEHLTYLYCESGQRTWYTVTSVELLKYLEQKWCKSFSIPVPSDCKKQFSTICNDQEKFTLHCKHLDIFNIWKMCKLYQGLLTKTMSASLLILSEKIYINILELYLAFSK